MNETSSVDTADQIVQDYLTAVARAAADLPAVQRAELLADLDEHIVVARSQHAPTEAGVRTILGRLGHPHTIVDAARVFAADNRADGFTTPPGPAPVETPAGIWHRSPLAVTLIVMATLIAMALIAGIVPTVLVLR